MTAKELQIGDWIRIKGNSCKVSYLAPFDIGDARLAIICNDYDGNPYLDGFEPIPLTPEILEKNGFNEFGGIWDFPNNSSFGVMITLQHKGIYPTFDESAYFVCGYVHELQHALRCCGLNDLADNFQV